MDISAKSRILTKPSIPSDVTGIPSRASPRQTVGFGIDADESREFQNLGRSQDFDHQIRADIARADDRYFTILVCSLIYHFTFPLCSRQVFVAHALLRAAFTIV